MRPLYFLLYVSLNYIIRLFYKERLVLNRPTGRQNSTIYVSNHSNSFMDPLVIGCHNYAVVQFMTRSDVFKWWLKPLLWAVNMLPIFRQQDGSDTKSANSESFNKVNESLVKGGNILIFGEGFTDDIPIRSLKPVKKGALRMGFQALEYCNWEKKIYVQALGVSYAERHEVGSDVVISNEDPICLNDYKEVYSAQPNKVINELTKVVEKGMQNSIIYVANKSWADFHENVMRITRKGYNHKTRNEALSLKERWLYGKNLASWLNSENPEENEDLQQLKKDMESYFALLKRMKIPSHLVPDSERNPLDRSKELLYILLLWPFMLIGTIHGFVPYILAKKLTEKMFARKVFWGSVKMMLAKFIGLAWNITLIVILSKSFGIHAWIGIVYFFFVPQLCFIAYNWYKNLKTYILKGKVAKADLKSFTAKKEELKKRIYSLIPVA